MSKNITISEGGIARQFGPTAKLYTDLQGGGTCAWVPEAEVQLGALTAYQNGRYTPDKTGKYGFDAATVNIHLTGPRGGDAYVDPTTGMPVLETPDGPKWTLGEDGVPTLEGVEGFDFEGVGIEPGADYTLTYDTTTGSPTVVGKKTDGEQHKTTVDPVTGATTDQVLPTSISIIAPPIRSLYTNGDSIDFMGLKVMALKADGTAWTEGGYAQGIIPASALLYPVTVAVLPSDAQHGMMPDFDLGDFWTPIEVGTSIAWNQFGDEKSYWHWEYEAQGCVLSGLYYINNWIQVIFASAEPGSQYRERRHYQWSDGSIHDERETTTALVSSYTRNGQTVYYAEVHNNIYPKEGGHLLYGPGHFDFDNPTGNQYSYGPVAWTMIYGEQIDPEHGTMTVPVQWLNPYTGETLQDTFTVTVREGGFGTASGGGGQTIGGGAGRQDHY